LRQLRGRHVHAAVEQLAPGPVEGPATRRIADPRAIDVCAAIADGDLQRAAVGQLQAQRSGVAGDVDLAGQHVQQLRFLLRRSRHGRNGQQEEREPGAQAPHERRIRTST
jgi:hypothetical protein